ncbi:MAG: amino acid adenylation domain-containing protein, partial [Candidatus Aminicenantes bacterium]|nr:amino acid adenylation domain-containing protein [Candidatus Aminicenantes bacterium]
PNGKLDRKALPAPEQDRQAMGVEYIAPRTPTEEKLVKTWCEVLHLDRIGIGDHFFQSGGHSLLATQVISRVRDEFDIELSVRSIFESPVLAQLAEIIDNNISTDLLRAPSPQRPVKRGETIPLSFAQQRLWFLDQFEPDTASYNIYHALRLSGHLNLEVLNSTFNEIVHRHEALRTVFTSKDGIPSQVVLKAVRFVLPVVDLEQLPEAEGKDTAEQLAIEEANSPFDLSRGPLFRATLLHLGETNHILLLTIHHIVSDGWSLGVLVSEMKDLYTAFYTGQPSPLPDLPVQYVDFSTWQRQWLSGDVLESQLSYWREQLGGDLPALELPSDYPRPASQTFPGKTRDFDFPADLTRDLNELARREGCTLFMVLLSVFKVLLNRYTGQTDITVGTPIANRNRTEIESLIGFFVNTLVLRSDLSENPTFQELLSRVREVSLAAYAHQDVPFEMLVDILAPERDMSHSPLFQVLFALQNVPIESLELPGLKLEFLDLGRRTSKFDLSVYLFEDEDRLFGQVEYNTDLFSEHTIERFIGHYRVLLESAAADAKQPLSELALLTAEEREQILVKWNDTAAEYPHEACIHDLFAARVDEAPGRVAVVCGEDHLTFSELDARANQLAHHLRRSGVKEETLVGVCMERSLGLPAALLGIFKAGGYYVPMDPTYPRERLAMMLEDISSFMPGNAPMLLSMRHFSDLFPGYSGDMILLDKEDSTIAALPRSAPQSLSCADHLAYTIFTSGSTGRPKGVQIHHRGMVNFLNSMRKTPGLNNNDILLSVTTLSFDISVLELFLPLTTGACVVLIDSETAADGAGLLKQMYRSCASVIQATPATYRLLTAAGWSHSEGLRVLCGGEELPSDLAAGLLSRGVNLWNMYGPTETTIWSSVFKVNPGFAVVSIGSPIDNTRMYILDRYLNPVPVGVPGELYIGGDELSRGYLNRPGLTADRFIPDAFGGRPGSRCYRTGDLVRYMPDGLIEFFGRLDYQVKVRGFRIELGEIESVMALHEDVSEVVVVVREDHADDKRIAAYFVPAEGRSIDANEIRRYLSEKLPGYMVPSVFVEMEAFPLTPNGKINRKALPAPGISGQETGVEYIAPRTHTEETLVKIWCEILQVDKIGTRDNFFQLGGHSLLATQVISRVRDEFNTELSVRSIFEAPVLSEFAEIIEKIVSPEIPIPPLEPVKREGNILLSFAQQRLWFLDQFEPDTASYNIYHALRLSGHLKVEALEGTFNEIVHRHEALRTVFTSKDGIPSQVVLKAVRFVLPVVDLEQLPEPKCEDTAEKLAVEEANHPFNLSRGPLFRVTLLRLSDTNHILLLTIHHIVSDGWSMGVLISEMKELYTAFYAGKPSPLPDLPVQYVDFSTWQRQWLSGDVLEAQLSYWREQLGGELPVLELPTDYPRPTAQTFSGKVRDFELPADLTGKLNELARGEGCSLFMVLLSIFNVLLNRYTGQTDITVGTPIASRNRTEVEGLIGFFVNTLVMRTDLSGNPTFKELLSQVRDISLSAYGHQDVPFEMLVDILTPERDMSHSPLFQVLFALQNMPREQLELPDLTLNSLYLGRQTSKFDLTLFMFEYEDRLIGRVEYNTDLFTDPTIERFIGHFRALLESVVTDAKQPLSELTMLTAAEREQILLKWNETSADYPAEKSIRELFEEQVQQNPDNIAVAYENKQSTYRELNEKADRLARDLIEKGVEAGNIVGIMEERSIEMIMGLLGILKTGGAYLPIDVNYPEQRIDHILKDGAVRHLLTPFHLEDSIKFEGSIIHIREEDLRCGSGSAPHPADSSGSLAYVMYTSGTTGRPKGILVDNRSVVRLVKNTNYVEFRQGDRILQTGALSFDASTFEIWGSLLNGLTLYLVDKDIILSPENIKKIVHSYQISILWMTAALFNRMSDADVRIFAPLGHLLVGGDVLSTPHINRVREAFPDLRIINGYGPTENTTFSTTFSIDEEYIQNIPIGSPIANSSAYVFDASKNIVPTGIMGELFVGGDGVARGYLNNPELTAQQFIYNPFKENERLYGTGDKVRRLHDGNIEFIGRFDHQVKIRGFRIELGEIESLIIKYSGVADATVLVREDVPREKQLVGYFVTVGKAEKFAINELREFLEQRLPGYMVPSAFVEMEVLPLTPNGKINRKALPAPERSRQETGVEYIAPRTDTEEKLVKIWC